MGIGKKQLSSLELTPQFLPINLSYFPFSKARPVLLPPPCPKSRATGCISSAPIPRRGPIGGETWERSPPRLSLPLPSSPFTRKPSGSHARMSDAWVLGLVPTLLLGLLAGLQQVRAREVELYNFQGSTLVGQEPSGAGSPPSIVRISS